METQNFQKDLMNSEISTNLLCDWINSQKGCEGSQFKAVSKEAGYATIPYDALVTFETGEEITIEVKAVVSNCYYGEWKTFFAEVGKRDGDKYDVWFVGSISSYIKSHKKVDFIVYYYFQTDEFYFYDCSKFAKYVWNNRCSDKEAFNKYESMWGIKFEKESEEIGFLGKFKRDDPSKDMTSFEYICYITNKYKKL